MKLLLSIILGLSFCVPSLAQPAQTCPKQVNPEGFYRARYEQAIRYGGFKRPSLVNNWQEAYRLANTAYKQGNNQEASIRFAQAAVILEFQRGTQKAEVAIRSMMYGIGIFNRSYLFTFNRMYTSACIQRQQAEFGL